MLKKEVVYTTKPVDERFWEKVLKTDTCWLWQGSKMSLGYGTFYLGRIDGKYRWVIAHRYAYESLVGPIPDKLYVGHLCKNVSCVKPDHLVVVDSPKHGLKGTIQ